MFQNHIMPIFCASLISVGLAMMCHESAHVLTGWMMGGDPTLLTATEVKGDFSSLSPLGFVIFGASGSFANLVLCGLGWAGTKRQNASSEFRLTAWFLFAFNGFIVTTKMITEPIIGLGDWMTVLHSVSYPAYFRVLIVVFGTVGLVFLVRRTANALALTVATDEPSRRVKEAYRIVCVGALASAALALLSSIFSPVGMTRAIVLALGGGLAPFIPMLFAARIVYRFSDEESPPSRNDRVTRMVLFLAAGSVAVVICFIFGPGLKV